MLTYLKKDDIIHKSGVIEMIKILDYQISHFQAYERPRLITEKSDLTAILEAMGDHETMIYREVENVIRGTKKGVSEV